MLMHRPGNFKTIPVAKSRVQVLEKTDVADRLCTGNHTSAKRFQDSLMDIGESGGWRRLMFGPTPKTRDRWHVDRHFIRRYGEHFYPDDVFKRHGYNKCTDLVLLVDGFTLKNQV